jgi:hypothetical protein
MRQNTQKGTYITIGILKLTKEYINNNKIHYVTIKIYNITIRIHNLQN